MAFTQFWRHARSCDIQSAGRHQGSYNDHKEIYYRYVNVFNFDNCAENQSARFDLLPKKPNKNRYLLKLIDLILLHGLSHLIVDIFRNFATYFRVKCLLTCCQTRRQDALGTLA